MRIIAGQRRGHKFDGPKGGDTRPTSDLTASAEYRAHLVSVLAGRAVAAAA